MSESAKGYFDSRTSNQNQLLKSNRRNGPKQDQNNISELNNDVDEQLTFRNEILKDPDFFKQLSLSFYTKKDRSFNPSPRNGESRSDLQTQRTPNPKEQDRSHLALPKPGNSYLKSPLQEKKYLCVKDEGSLNTSRTRESCSENTDPNQVQCSSRLIGSGIDRSLTKSDHSSVNTSDIDNGYKQTTPKTFKISKLKASGNKKILFKIPSPLKREHSSTIAKPLASPQIKILNAPNPLSVRAKKSGGSNGSSEMSSHAPSTGATTPRSKNSIVNAPVSISERERIQIAKTLKLQPGKVKLKIAIPDDRSAVQSSLKPGKLHSVRSPSKKMTSPQGIKYSITPMSVRTPTEKYCSPNRPITPGSATNSSQFRAARLLFQKEPKKAEPEQMHEKLFEKYFEKSEATESRAKNTLKRK